MLRPMARQSRFARKASQTRLSARTIGGSHLPAATSRQASITDAGYNKVVTTNPAIRAALFRRLTAAE